MVDLEWVNILSGQAWAAARVEEDRNAAELTVSYSESGADCFDLRLRPKERIGSLESVRARIVAGAESGETGAMDP